MKSLPTLREKRRYIVFRVHSEGPIPYPILKEAVLSSLLEFLGERDFAKANLRLVRNLWNGREGFLQASSRFVDPAKVALALIHQIGEQKALFQTLKVAGTIKSGKKALKKPADRGPSLPPGNS